VEPMLAGDREEALSRAGALGAAVAGASGQE
jgi:hypothetical protein